MLILAVNVLEVFDLWMGITSQVKRPWSVSDAGKDKLKVKVDVLKLALSGIDARVYKVSSTCI